MPTFFSFLFLFFLPLLSFPLSTTEVETRIGVPKRYDSLFEQVYLIERFCTYGTGELMKLGIRFVIEMKLQDLFVWNFFFFLNFYFLKFLFEIVSPLFLSRDRDTNIRFDDLWKFEREI